MDLRESIAKEPGLISRAVFNGKNVCALGSLIPLAERGSSNGLVQKLLGERYDITWAGEPAPLFVDTIVNKNDAFDGSLEERRNYMLAWIEKRLSDQLAKEIKLTRNRTDEVKAAPA